MSENRNLKSWSIFSNTTATSQFCRSISCCRKATAVFWVPDWICRFLDKVKQLVFHGTTQEFYAYTKWSCFFFGVKKRTEFPCYISADRINWIMASKGKIFCFKWQPFVNIEGSWRGVIHTHWQYRHFSFCCWSYENMKCLSRPCCELTDNSFAPHLATQKFRCSTCYSVFAKWGVLRVLEFEVWADGFCFSRKLHSTLGIVPILLWESHPTALPMTLGGDIACHHNWPWFLS